MSIKALKTRIRITQRQKKMCLLTLKSRRQKVKKTTATSVRFSNLKLPMASC